MWRECCSIDWSSKRRRRIMPALRSPDIRRCWRRRKDRKSLCRSTWRCSSAFSRKHSTRPVRDTLTCIWRRKDRTSPIVSRNPFSCFLLAEPEELPSLKRDKSLKEMVAEKLRKHTTSSSGDVDSEATSTGKDNRKRELRNASNSERSNSIQLGEHDHSSSYVNHLIFLGSANLLMNWNFNDRFILEKLWEKSTHIFFNFKRWTVMASSSSYWIRISLWSAFKMNYFCLQNVCALIC